MHVDRYVSVLSRDGERLAEAARRAGLDAAVPTCPGWQIRDLLLHTGGVHRWAAGHVETGRAEPFSAAEEDQFFEMVADDSLLEWFRDGHRRLVGALAAGDEELVSCWTFLPARSPLAFWARRQAHETAIHRADAEAALSVVPQWTADFAVDGIDELLNAFLVRRPERITADPPVSIAVSATDADAAWTITLDPTGYRAVAGARPATLTLAGPASDRYLLLWNRGGLDRLDERAGPVAGQGARRLVTSAADLAALRELVEPGAVPGHRSHLPAERGPDAVRHLEVEHARAKVVLTI
jgi:uncharacterized protein (TIGR03083 family)